jgi:Arc/MetJ-type ribon-helix-helix transcriptional regulator
MERAVKRTISLPYEMAKEVEEVAREERKTISAVIQEALRVTKKERLKRQFYEIQGYWGSKAKEKGILTEKDLKRYLES